MTIKEAIEVLKNLHISFEDSDKREKIKEALEIAIAVLDNEDY
jgi:hypothetical protein